MALGAERDHDPGMLTKALLFTILTAITSVPDTPTRKVLPVESEGQHFCCESVVGHTGEGCVEISGTAESIDSCDAVLYCESSWTWVDDGKVTCG